MYLQVLRGAMHIMQPFRINISYLKGPTLLTEWIENGLVLGLVNRLPDFGQPLPNRMLWRFFLCCKVSRFFLMIKQAKASRIVCRMCIGMAWHPKRGPTEEQVLEAIPAPDRGGVRPPESRFAHGDLNIENGKIFIGTCLGT